MYVGVIFLFGSPDLYKEAQNAYNKGDFELARKKVEQFIIKEPINERTPEALYLATKLRRKSDEALNYYKKIVNEYPNSEITPDALYNIGQYFYTKRDYLSGIETYKKIVSDYPNSKLTQECKKWIELIQAFYFIQVGSFSAPDNAFKLAEKLKKFAPLIIKKEGFHKVWIGPFVSREEAKVFMINNGLQGFATSIK